MKKEQFIENFRTFLKRNPPMDEIEEIFRKALESGVLNYADEEQGSYRLAKLVYHAILSKMAKEWKPLIKENRQEAETVKIYLK